MSQRGRRAALKRKRELSDAGPETPSHAMVGVVTSAVQWVFVKLDEAGRVYQQSVPYEMGFSGGSDREKEVSALFAILHNLFLGHCRAVDALHKSARLAGGGESGDEAVAAVDDLPSAQD